MFFGFQTIHMWNKLSKQIVFEVRDDCFMLISNKTRIVLLESDFFHIDDHCLSKWSPPFFYLK